MKVEKSAIRQRILAERKALPPVAVAAAGEAVFGALRSMAAYRTAAAVVSYVAHDNEVPTDRVLRDVNRSGRLLYLPLTKGAPGFRRWQSTAAWTKGIGGVPELIGQPEPLPDVPTVILLPLVGWSGEGGRLGRGGGFYDRMLADKSEHAVLIGLAYEFQKVPAMPWEPWDVGLDYVITQLRIVRCAAPADARHSSEEGVTKTNGLFDSDWRTGASGRPGGAVRDASALPDSPAGSERRGNGTENPR